MAYHVNESPDAELTRYADWPQGFEIVYAGTETAYGTMSGNYFVRRLVF